MLTLVFEIGVLKAGYSVLRFIIELTSYQSLKQRQLYEIISHEKMVLSESKRVDCEPKNTDQW